MLGSSALRAFGYDSVVELLAGVILMVRLLGLGGRSLSERATGRLIAGTFVLIAVMIGVDALNNLVAVTGVAHAHVTLTAAEAQGGLGAAERVAIGLSVFTALTMYPLAWAKTRVARALHSDSAQAESRQTMLCGHMSWLLLVGLAGVQIGALWLDPVVALLIGAIALLEARRAWSSGSCSCHAHLGEHDFVTLRPQREWWLPNGVTGWLLRWRWAALWICGGLLALAGALHALSAEVGSSAGALAVLATVGALALIATGNRVRNTREQLVLGSVHKQVFTLRSPQARISSEAQHHADHHHDERCGHEHHDHCGHEHHVH